MFGIIDFSKNWSFWWEISKSWNHCVFNVVTCLVVGKLLPTLRRCPPFASFRPFFTIWLCKISCFLRFQLVSPPLHPIFHVCCLSLSSPSLSILPSPPLLSWSRWLILKGNSESEWDLKEKEERCSTQQGHPSLDWYAARRGKKKTTHGIGEPFLPSAFLFPPPLFSSLLSLLSCLISHFSFPSVGAWI